MPRALASAKVLRMCCTGCQPRACNAAFSSVVWAPRVRSHSARSWGSGKPWGSRAGCGGPNARAR
eukprot:199432-Lingulodinium_polyedra.AAC.1